MDRFYPPLTEAPAAQIFEIAKGLPDKAQIRVQVKGETLEGRAIDKVVMLPVGDKSLGDGVARLKEAAGLELKEEDGKLIIYNLVFGGVAEKQKLDFDWEIASVKMENTERPAKQWLYILAGGLLALVWFSQRSRVRKEKPLEVKHV